MSGAQWRQAMNAGAGRLAMGRATPAAPATARRGSATTGVAGSAPGRIASLVSAMKPRHWLVLLLVLAYPLFATNFLVYQVGAQSLALGLIALSLTFLGGYGGMISLAQMTVAGVAGYMLAVFGASGEAALSFGWAWWVAVPIAILVAVIVGTFVGWLSVRTEGIYTIMITLAMGVAFYYLCLQNYTVFNGFQGFQRVYAPTVLGVNLRDPVAFYYLALACALGGYWLVQYVLRAPFGVALQGIRDNPRRMNALGFHVTAHRVAAYAFAAVLAAVGGILFTWYNGLITPNSVGTSWLINVLIIAVLGGMKHPIGAFIGAIIFVLLQTFAIDIIDRERFNLVIGGVFLAIVLFSPDGLLGLWAKLRGRLSTRRP
ncbi:MAG: branched-chain amino acid ABC transporter permease [Burkholderiales bacterium]